MPEAQSAADFFRPRLTECAGCLTGRFGAAKSAKPMSDQGRTAPTRRLSKQPLAQLGDELSLTDRFGMYSEPTRLLNVNGGFRAPRSLSAEISKSAVSLVRTFLGEIAMTAPGRVRESNLPLQSWRSTPGIDPQSWRRTGAAMAAECILHGRVSRFLRTLGLTM